MGEHSSQAVSRSATIVLIAIALVYAAEPLLRIGRPGPLPAALLLLGLAAFSTALARVLWRGARGAPSATRTPFDLLVVGYAALAMCLQFGLEWAALPALFSGAAAVTLSRYRALAAVLVALSVELYAGLKLHLPALTVVDLLGRASIVIIVIYAVGKILSMGREIERNRTELARLAVLEERLRFSRDLHDLVSHSLSVISLRSEVATRLAERDLPRAGAEMGAVVEISRQAISDVRSLVRGYREQSLASELDGVVSVLEAAGVHVEVTAARTDLPQHLQDTFRWVVREAATNILRHSSATNCTVEVSSTSGGVAVEVINDGVADRSAGRVPGGGGHGLEGLSERLALIGGSLSCGRVPGGGFRVHAWAPEQAVAGAGGTSAGTKESR